MEARSRWHHSAEWMRQTFLSMRFSILTILLLAPSLGRTQVTTNITSSGLNTQVNQVGNSHNITGGTRPGGGPNLFHSFGDFSVGPGDTANFSTLNTPIGTVPIANILGRVTGGNSSNIYGTLKTTEFGNANLFLMNPSGIVLGPGASLNVGGSVSFTTAQYLRLLDGQFQSAHFYANPASDGLANSVLAINPSAFEFVTASPTGYGFLTTPSPTPTITVQGSNLLVPSGQSISLVGGKVVIESGAQLTAPGGNIKLASAASPGEFDIATLGPFSDTNTPVFTSHASMSLLSGSSIDVHGSSTVLIKGGQLLLSVNDASLSTAEVQPNTISLGPGSSIITSNSGADFGVDVQLTAPRVNLNGSFISTQADGIKRGGNITVTAERLTLDQFAGIFTETRVGSPGPGGNVLIQGPAGMGGAATSVTLSGFSQIGTSTGGNGVGGNITLTTASLDLSGTSSIISSTFGNATNGNITVRVQDARLTDASHFLSDTSSSLEGLVGGSITVQGLNGGKAASLTFEGLESGIRAETVGINKLGNILVKTETLKMMDGAIIQSGTPFAFGSAGTITIDAGLVDMTGQSRISSSAFNLDAGPVTITANQITLDNSTIATDTSSSIGGRGGDVILNVSSANFSNGATMTSSASNAGVAGNITIGGNASHRPSVAMTGGSAITASSTGSGNAGAVTINASTLHLDNASINTGTTSTGHAGSITAKAGTITLTNGSTISSSSTGTATGNAGSITIDGPTSPAQAVSITDSSLLTTAEHTGQGGSISVKATNLTLNNATISASVKDFGAAVGTGNIDLSASTMTMTGGAISAATSGTRNAGTVSLNAGSFAMANGTITTNTSSSGAAGTISLTATGNGVSVSGGSSITSATTSAGNAGQVVMTTPTLTMNNATMTTSTSSTGHAGSITTKVGTLTMTNGSTISSSSTGTATGKAGSITIEGPTTPAQAVTITDSSLLTTAEHTGQGGSISVNATNLALNHARISASVKNRQASENPSSGTANIDLSTESMTMNGSRITAESLGSRNAGNILINRPTALGKHFEMVNSQINTSASLADGGNIAIYTKDMVRLTDSTITSSVGSETIKTTQGGNITIDPDFVILKGSEIRANAFAGTGGAIDITSGLFLADAVSLVDASSTLGVSGSVQINSPINNLSSVVARLTESLLEVQALLRASCAARLSEGATSSFVERGRDGIPAGPDALLATPYVPMTVSQAEPPTLGASTGLSGIRPGRLFGRGMPSSVTLFSDHTACAP